jgi:hypothetical protein
MSTNQTTAGEVMYRTNRRNFLGYLSAAPTLTAFAGAGLLSTQSAIFRRLRPGYSRAPTQATRCLSGNPSPSKITG